jgi:hypothetical protein
VRLVKGAYWDSEVAWARQKSWPVPVFLDKSETDASYERLSRLLLENHDMIDTAFGSHNLRTLAHAIVTAKMIGVPNSGYEIQMLYGMAEPVRQANGRCSAWNSMAPHGTHATGASATAARTSAGCRRSSRTSRDMSLTSQASA